MITVCMRLFIVLLGCFLVSIVSGFNSISFIFAVIFVCVWVSIRQIHMIFWWIITFAFFFSIMNYDYLAGYFIGIVGAAFIFDLTKKHIARSGYESGFAFYFLSLTISIIIFLFTNFLYEGYFTMDMWNMIYTIIFSVMTFFVLRWTIIRIEKFASLYTRGTDLKIHT